MTPGIITIGIAAAVFLLWRERDFWTGVIVALAVWPIVWPFYLVAAIPWAAVVIATTSGRARRAAMVAAYLFVIASLPGTWWAATAGTRPGLWWLAPLASLIGIGASLLATHDRDLSLTAEPPATSSQGILDGR